MTSEVVWWRRIGAGSCTGVMWVLGACVLTAASACVTGGADRISASEPVSKHAEARLDDALKRVVADDDPLARAQNLNFEVVQGHIIVEVLARDEAGVALVRAWLAELQAPRTRVWADRLMTGIAPDDVVALSNLEPVTMVRRPSRARVAPAKEVSEDRTPYHINLHSPPGCRPLSGELLGLMMASDPDEAAGDAGISIKDGWVAVVVEVTSAGSVDGLKSRLEAGVARNMVAQGSMIRAEVRVENLCRVASQDEVIAVRSLSSGE